MGKSYMCVRRNNVVLIRKSYLFLMFKLSFKNLLWNWKMRDKWYKLLYACVNACFKINAWESRKMRDTWQACVLLRAFHSDRDMGGRLPPPHVYLTPLPHQSQCPTMGHPIYKWSPHWKVNPSFGKWSLEKKQ